VQFTDDNLQLNGFEIFADARSTISLKVISNLLKFSCFSLIKTNIIYNKIMSCQKFKILENDACKSVNVGSCASYLAQSSTDIHFIVGQIFEISLNPGYNNISISETVLVPKRALLGLEQYNLYGIAVDSSGASNKSDYVLNAGTGVIDVSSPSHQLAKLNESSNYRFYIRAIVSQLILG
jgi:hypothetical protein